MVRIAWLAFAFLVTAVVACGGSASTATPVPPGVAIQGYIDTVTPIFDEAKAQQADVDANHAVGRRTPASEAAGSLTLQVKVKTFLVESLEV